MNWKSKFMMVTGKPGEIPNDLYFSTAQKLSKAITEGVGDSFSYDDPSNSLAAELRANLYQFSGAKSLTHANALRDLLVDENGKEKSFNQFKQDVQSTNKFYNEQALSAEYSNALAQGQMAVKWQDFEALGKDAWLEYRTAGDDRVRASQCGFRWHYTKNRQPVLEQGISAKRLGLQMHCNSG